MERVKGVWRRTPLLSLFLCDTYVMVYLNTFVRAYYPNNKSCWVLVILSVANGFQEY